MANPDKAQAERLRLQAQATLARIAAGGVGHNRGIVRELPELRTQFSKTFLNADGTRTLVAHGKALHRRDSPGQPWQDIDFTARTDYYGEAADGYIYGTNAVYATARSTSNGADSTSASARMGQSATFTVFRSFLSFDTSGIPDDQVVTAATLYVCAYTDDSDTDFNIQVYLYNWLETLAANREADYDGAYGGSATLEGTLRDTADGWVSGTYYSLAVTNAGINLTGDSKYTMVSSRDIAGTQPSGNEIVYWYTSERTGTSQDPYLAITYTTPTNVTVSPPVATATAAALVPAITAIWNVVIAVVVAVATALAFIPDITTTQSVSISPPVATATAEALVPALAIGPYISPPVAVATAEALVPVVTSLASVTVSPPVATATAEAPVPVVIHVTQVSPPVATATASALTPTVTTKRSATISPPAATATAAAMTPGISTVPPPIQPLKIIVNGTDRTTSIDVGSIRITDGLHQAKAADFVLLNVGGIGLAELQTVIISNLAGTVRYFAGYVQKITTHLRGPFVDAEIACVDYSFYLEHPEAVVYGGYFSKSDQYIIQHALPTACPDLDCTTYVYQVLADTVFQGFAYETPRALLDRLAKIAGAYWYVDEGPGTGGKLCYLHYFAAGATAGPFTLSDAPDNNNSFPYEKLQKITEAPSANKVFVVGSGSIRVTRTLGAEGDYGWWLTAVVKDKNVTTTAQAQALGDAVLAQMAAGPSYTCTIRQPGLRAGELVTLVNAAQSINAAYVVNRVVTGFEGGGYAKFDLELGKHIPPLPEFLAKLGGSSGSEVEPAPLTHTHDGGANGEQLSYDNLTDKPTIPTAHDAVTLGASLESNLLSLGVGSQQLTLDSQAANLVFAGPAIGLAAAPAFRALVADDLGGHLHPYYAASGGPYDTTTVEGHYHQVSISIDWANTAGPINPL